jgi:tetratricopeptide (TPR) repeat protein
MKQSIQSEERYDNVMNKSKILEAMDRKQDAEMFHTKALNMANPLQLYFYARQLQADKKQEQALVIYRSTAKKFPDYWTTHLGLARVYSAQGDFDNAVKEVKLSLTGAPDSNKPNLENYVKRLQAKEDINR